MTTRIIFILILFIIPNSIFSASPNSKWIYKNYGIYEIFYTLKDKNNIDEYGAMFEIGKKTVNDFWKGSFKNNFEVYIHPNRISLDSAWQTDWEMPDFKSQCWMVASGVSDKFDIISPKYWDIEACEHSYSNKTKTQQLITHELVHVYHGQYNQSYDFSNVNGIDWFIEGLATYASGQCDSIRISEVQIALKNNNIPKNLIEFWSGKMRYGLSATVVMYIDHKYGREKLHDLLSYNEIDNILNSLNISEVEMINEWKSFIKDY